MINPDHERLSICRQCELVSISRASFYRQPAGETPENLELMRIIDEAFMEMPWYGSRQMARHLRRQGWCIGRKRVRRLMRRIGLSPIYQAPKTSEPHPQHRIYPYLLRHLAIGRPNQVWCADVTYRSGQPVHQLRLHHDAEGCRHPHLHGRARPLDGQRLHRAAMAQSQI